MIDQIFDQSGNRFDKMPVYELSCLIQRFCNIVSYDLHHLFHDRNSIKRDIDKLTGLGEIPG